VYKYSLTEIEFQSGEKMAVGGLAVVVGPNNSGKSQLLKDIELLCTQENPPTVVIKGLTHTVPESLEDLKASYRVAPERDANGYYHFRGFRSDLAGTYSLGLGSSDWEAVAKQAIGRLPDDRWARGTFASWFGQRFVTRLRTEDRLLLTKKSSRADVNSILGEFYDQGMAAEARLTKWVDDAFGTQVRLDYSDKAEFLFRVGTAFDGVPADAREANPIMQAYLKLDDQGDGLRSFVATAVSLLVNRRSVLLLDEPEAFLHPPQAVAIGQVIAEVAQEGQQVIVATHSADVLRGILSRTSDIGLIRLSRSAGVGKVTVMNAGAVNRVANDPLLSSTRVLDGLFYRGVVVVEADSDSVFYQRVAAKIRSGDEIHYVQAHNKQTLAKVAAPYRSLGLPVAVVPDFDVLRDRQEFKALLQAIQAEGIEVMLKHQESIRSEIEGQPISERLSNLREAIEKALVECAPPGESSRESEALSDIKRRLKKALEESDAWSAYKRRGRGELTPSTQQCFDSIDRLGRRAGLFIVPVGELESWLVEFGIPRLSQKNHWIVQALTKLSDLELPPESALSAFVRGLHDHLLE